MHRVRFGALCVTLLVSAVLASGCVGAAPSPDASLVKATVERYDALLAQGYRSMDMSPISEVATQLQAETEYIHMSSLGEGGVRMLPNLRRLEFVKVSVEGSSALVETLETWDYTHVDPATGAIVREQRGLVYRLAWDLARQADGRWLVSDVRAINATTTGLPTSLAPTSTMPGE
jgi:hypothetical protein